MDQAKAKKLREAARKLLKTGTKPQWEDKAADELIEELSTFQIELEMQNDELQKAHDELNQLHKRYFDLYEFAPSAYLTIDVDTRVIEVNQTFCKMVGYPRDKVAGEKFSRFVHPNSQDELYLKCKTIFSQTETVVCEIALIHADTNTIYVRIDGKKIVHTTGISAVRMSLVDISETILAQQEINQQQQEIASQNEELMAQNEEFQAINEELTTANNALADANHKLEISLSKELGYLAEREKTIRILEEKEESYRLLFQNNPQPMWIYDPETLAFLEVNETALNQYGYTREEFLTKTLADIRPPEDVPLLLDDIKNAINGLNSAGVWRHIKKSGETIFVETFSHTVNFNGRNARHVMAVDITERKKMQDQLIERNDFIQTVLDNLPIGLAINRFDEGDATYVNRKFEEIYGWPKEELRNVQQFFIKVYPDAEYRESLVSRVMDDLNSKDPSRMHWEGVKATTSTGEKRILNAVNIPLFDQNVMVSTVMDVTGAKMAEQELEKHRNHLEELVKQRTEELDAKNKELERMNKLFVGREFRIKELKEKAANLENILNKTTER